MPMQNTISYLPMHEFIFSASLDQTYQGVIEIVTYIKHVH